MYPRITSTITGRVLIIITILTLIATAPVFATLPCEFSRENIHDSTPAAGTIFGASSVMVDTKIIPATCEFYGNVTIRGKPAVPGTIISAAINREEHGRTTTIREGVYGIPDNLTVRGDRKDLNQTITFWVNGQKADQTAIFFHPDCSKLDLTVTNLTLVPKFSANITSGTKPLTVQFTDLSEGEPVKWFWTFGEGTNSTQKNPVHTYTTKGRYNVSLLIYDINGNKAQITKFDYISVKEAEPPEPGGGGGGFIPLNNSGTGTQQNGTYFKIWSDDHRVCLETIVATVVRTAEGQYINPYKSLSITKILTDEVPQSISTKGNASFATYAYRCYLDGALFSSPVTLSFFFSEEEWEMIDTANSSIRWNNRDTGLWEDTETFVDNENRRIYTRITHFSIYALFAQLIDKNEDRAIQFPLQINFDIIWLLLIIIAVIAIISREYIKMRRKKRKP